MKYEIVNVEAVPMSAAKPEVDPALDAIVLECLAKEPDERYQSIKEVSKELRRFKRTSSRAHASRVMPTRPLTPLSRELPSAGPALPPDRRPRPLDQNAAHVSPGLPGVGSCFWESSGLRWPSSGREGTMNRSFAHRCSHPRA